VYSGVILTLLHLNFMALSPDRRPDCRLKDTGSNPEREATVRGGL